MTRLDIRIDPDGVEIIGSGDWGNDDIFEIIKSEFDDLFSEEIAFDKELGLLFELVEESGGPACFVSFDCRFCVEPQSSSPYYGDDPGCYWVEVDSWEILTGDPTEAQDD